MAIVAWIVMGHEQNQIRIIPLSLQISIIAIFELVGQVSPNHLIRSILADQQKATFSTIVYMSALCLQINQYFAIVASQPTDIPLPFIFEKVQNPGRMRRLNQYKWFHKPYTHARAHFCAL